MSEITAALAREVLEIALVHAPEALDELLRLHAAACDADGEPAEVALARVQLERSLRDAALDVEDYATATAAKVAML